MCSLDSGYNPPKFALDAAKDALDRVDCNQYSPTKVYWVPGRQEGRKALDTSSYIEE